MTPQTRHSRIMDLLTAQGEAQVTELAASLGVSAVSYTHLTLPTIYSV